MLKLQSLCLSMDKLGDLCIEEKQTKYFDYLADAAEMNSDLEILKVNKIVIREFRNNMRLLIIYEQSVA